MVLAVPCVAAVWEDRILETQVAGGISAARFGGGQIAVAYARPASNQVIVGVMQTNGALVRTVLGSAVAARNVELCAVSASDTDLYAAWDDGAGNLFWARKNDGWTVRAVQQEQGVSNTFALQLYRISYTMPGGGTISLTVPMIYYRNETQQQLERVFVSGYNPVGGVYTWSREVILAGADAGKGCDSSSVAGSVYAQMVAHCAGARNDNMLSVWLGTSWTNMTVMSYGNGLPPMAFEQGADDLPRMVFHRWFVTNVLIFTYTNSGVAYFDLAQLQYNLIEIGLMGAGNGTAPALKLNHLGQPLSAYYWGNGTVHCALRGGQAGGLVWTSETCGTGRWDGVSPSIDIATDVSNTYVFYVNADDHTLHCARAAFVPPDKMIYGMVSNIWTGEAVSNALVLATEPAQFIFQADVSDRTGMYALMYLPTGQYTVACTASNYFTHTTNITLTGENSPCRLELGLVPVPEAGGVAACGLVLAYSLSRRDRTNCRRTQ